MPEIAPSASRDRPGRWELLGATLVALLLPAVGVARPLSEHGTVAIQSLDATDPHWPALRTAIDELSSVPADSPYETTLGEIRPIDTAATRSVFPGWSFYRVDYRNTMRPEHEDSPISIIPFGTHSLHVEPDGRLSRSNYNELLQAAGVLLEGDSDAEMIWEAYCDIYRHGHGKDARIERVSTGLWLLGITRSERTPSGVGDENTSLTRTYYHRVETAPESGRILSWQLASEETEGPAGGADSPP